MNTATARQLVDKIYEKRKAAALDLEKQIRECNQQGEEKRIDQIIDQLIEMFNNTVNPLHIRNGGLIGLAGTAIALGVDIAPYMDKFIGPLLDCFVDPESKVRYFSAECLYNIAKVSKGEILVYFNDIFDALSKLAADPEISVKNGAELLDRLLKDIVAEFASVYIPQSFQTNEIREKDAPQGVLVPVPDPSAEHGTKKAFSLARFIPLLRERIYVLSPFTRSYLVSWITVLDSVPELELLTFLPEFLDGLLKYLSDPTEDVRVATENLLGCFISELQTVAVVRTKGKGQAKAEDGLPAYDGGERRLDEDDDTEYANGYAGNHSDEAEPEVDERDTGAWVPGQGVRIDYPAIVEILIQQVDGEHDEIQQATALHWLAEFLQFSEHVMIPFTPRLIPAILPNLAHHVPMIAAAALVTNKLLFATIQKLPSPTEAIPKTPGLPGDRPIPASKIPRSPTPTTGFRSNTLSSNLNSSSTDLSTDATVRNAKATSEASTSRPNTNTAEGAASNTPSSRPHSPVSLSSQPGTSTAQPNSVQPPEEIDLFDYQATVNELTVQFISEFEETRVAALKWLIMLHQKAPKKILAMDDGTFPALLKTLSDSSEEVIKHDLQLLAQISSSSEEAYFRMFMNNLLGLFSTDRKLLETRGSLIIRQLCLNLNTERIYRTFAEILEKEDDLEFASEIVQKLNIILITSPELADFRKRLKNLETRQDGQALFTSLYRSWCHNPVAAFSLCLLAQAYEHASNLLTIFADFEITVPMLVQVDKLVQLIESPVFTYLRLQLLEPDRYPYLLKCLYGILMLLPQSSAFVSLRNRLNAVNASGFLHIAPKPPISNLASTRSKISRDEIKWQELLQHFRSVQMKHEKARRLAQGPDAATLAAFPDDKPTDGQDRGGRTPRPVAGRPPVRRRVTGEVPTPPPPVSQPVIPPRPSGTLSPLNPGRTPTPRVPNALSGLMGSPTPTNLPSHLNIAASLTHAQRQRRPDLINK